MGVFDKLFHKTATHDSETLALAEAIVALLRATTLERKRELIQANPGLLTDLAQRMLEAMAANEKRENFSKAMLAHRDLLRRSREVKVLEALEELGQPARSDEMQKRIELCTRTLQLIKQDQYPEYWAILQLNLANSLAELPQGDRAENLDQAIASYEMALQVLSQKVRPVDWALTQSNLATAYLRRIRGDRAENLERAIACYEAALKVRTKEERPAEWAQSQTNLASVYQVRVLGDRAENIERTIVGCQAALEVQKKEAMPIEWARTQMCLANAYSDRMRGVRANNFERAIAGYEAALEVQTRQTTPVDWALTQMNLANVYFFRITGERAENLERAIVGYRRALEVQTRQTMPVEWALTQTNLSIAYSHRIRGDRAENLEQAITGYEAALEVRTRESMAVEWATTEMNLASAYQKRKRGDRAENLKRAITGYEAALRVLTRETMPMEWAVTQTNLATAYRTRVGTEWEEDLERAIAGYTAALEVEKKETMPVEWAMTQSNLGSAYRNRIRGERAENLERAIAAYEAALDVWTQQGMRSEWAETQTNLANVYGERVRGVRQENVERAIVGFEAALKVRTRQAAPVEHLRVQLGLGRLLFQENRWKQACSALGQAMATQELLYQTASTPEARQGMLREFSDIHPMLSYVLAKENGGKDLAQAITVAERGRARSMAEALALDEAVLGAASADDIRAFGNCRERIQRLQAEARLPDSASGRRDFLTISSELGRTYAELEKSICQIRAYVPEFLPETRFEDLQKAAITCPVLYLISTTTGGLGLLLGRSGGVEAMWLPGLDAAELRKQVLQYFDLYSNMRAEPEAWMQGLDGMLRWLWDAGIGRVVSALNGQREAVLVPGGLLGLLPLHAAWTPDANTVTGRLYAFDTVRFRYAPSATALMAASRSATHISADSILAVDEPKPVGGPMLPNSQYEIQSVVSHFNQSRVLRHEAATRAALQLLLPRYAVLHLSCHGFANFNEPLEGGLAMANDEILSLRDFLDIHLPNARLAVLSACETAISGVELPDEALSLPSGLMQAGVAGVVGSLWSVRDDSTMVLMCRFYDLWRQVGLPPAEALREAQQWVRDTTNGEKVEYFKQPLPEFAATRMPVETADSLYKQFSIRDPNAREFSHPFHWAAFCYVGV